MCEIAIELMSEGASKTEVAAEIGITRDTFHRWVKENPLFSDTIKRGEQLSQRWWERHGRTQLENGKFNSTLWYMNMKNRFGWRDKQDHTTNGESISVSVNHPMKFEDE